MPYLSAIIELLIYLTGAVTVVGLVLWALLSAVWWVIVLIKRHKTVIEAIIYLARRRKGRVRR